MGKRTTLPVLRKLFCPPKCAVTDTAQTQLHQSILRKVTWGSLAFAWEAQENKVENRGEERTERRTEGRRNPELTRSSASRRVRSVCASCPGGWDVSALSLQLSCTVLGVPWGGAAAGERGKAHQGLAHNLHTNLSSNGKLHLGNPN